MKGESWAIEKGYYQLGLLFNLACTCIDDSSTESSFHERSLVGMWGTHPGIVHFLHWIDFCVLL